MKKLLILLLALVLVGLSGCGNEMDRGKNRPTEKTTDLPQSPEKDG
jgi:hypothetical protein